MMAVDQTTFGGKKCNCWSACIASILEMPTDKVPNFCAGIDENGKPGAPSRWAQYTERWLNRRGFTGIFFNKPHVYRPNCWHIASGKSPRGDFNHAVVAFGTELRHDPHPSGDFLDCDMTELADTFLIIKQGIV